MKTVVYKQIKSHIKDGMLKTAANLLRVQKRDTERYHECYILLYQMALKLAQHVGPLSQDVYNEILFCSRPLKGGVSHE